MSDPGTAPTRAELLAALKTAHELIQDFDAITDPETQPELCERADAILLPCDEADHCPTVPASLPAPPAVTPPNDWARLLEHEGPQPYPVKEAAFLRIYARMLLAGHPWDTPRTMAACMEQIARRIEEQAAALSAWRRTP